MPENETQLIDNRQGAKEGLMFSGIISLSFVPFCL